MGVGLTRSPEPTSSRNSRARLFLARIKVRYTFFFFNSMERLTPGINLKSQRVREKRSEEEIVRLKEDLTSYLARAMVKPRVASLAPFSLTKESREWTVQASIRASSGLARSARGSYEEREALTDALSSAIHLSMARKRETGRREREREKVPFC